MQGAHEALLHEERLEGILGRRGLAIWEGLVSWLILAVLGLILADHYLAADPEAGMEWSVWMDTAICALLLLLDFFTRLALTPGRASYLARNFLTEFLPSLSFGVLASMERVSAVGSARLGHGGLRPPRKNKTPGKKVVKW